MVYESMLRANVAQEIIDEFARISPVAWIHILFTGRYKFNKSDAGIDVQEMARMLEKALRASFWWVGVTDQPHQHRYYKLAK